MIIKHIALCSSSEENADKFYRDLLGLSKMEPKRLSSSLIKAIFNIHNEMTVINYQNDTIRFEIFIHALHRIHENPVEHACIEVPNMDVFLDTCRKMDVTIRQVPKDDKIVTFISDFDGNLFELK